MKKIICLSVLLMLALAGCEKQIEQPTMKPLSIGTLNYTDDYIDDYIDEIYVNGSWAANVLPHGGGGAGAGSAMVPRQWSPEYTLNIEWQTHAWGRDESIVSHERKIEMEPYQQEAGTGRMTFLWVAFFPDGTVKLYPTWVGPRHPDFPDGLNHPMDTCIRESPDPSRCKTLTH